MLAVLLIILAAAVQPASAQTEVELGIKSSFAAKIPLWLPPFELSDTSLTSVCEEVENLVRADLGFSGLFDIKRYWKPGGVNTDGLKIAVRGEVYYNSGKKIFEGKVFDLSSGRMIGGKRYALTRGIVRRVAHHFSDEVVRILTGEKGVASTKILYVRKRGVKWELVMCDYDGYNPKVLLRMNQPVLNPRWIKGGEAFVYTGYQFGKADLFTRRLEEPSSRPLATFKGLNYSVDWSEKLKSLLLTLSRDGNPELYLMNAEGRLEKRLTYNRAIDCSPSWSPSGREIVFTSDRSGSPQIYVMEADGSNVRRLTYFGGYNASPSWSPKGNLIAFVSRIDGVFQLCVMKPDGSDVTLLTSDDNNHDSPRWAPDGRHIIHTEQGKDGSVISIVDISTRGKRILSRGRTPDWSPR